VRQNPAARLGQHSVAKPQYEPEELNRIGFRLYETFRPEVPSDVKGWGAKGMLDLAKIRDAAT
jgi:hypothetical protein